MNNLHALWVSKNPEQYSEQERAEAVRVLRTPTLSRSGRPLRSAYAQQLDEERAAKLEAYR